MKKVLAFFGAFNPPTNAHIDLAMEAKCQTESDGVLFVPSKQKYIANVQEKDFAFSDEARYKMLSAIAANNCWWMKVSRHDINCSEQPRTYKSLCDLRCEGYDPSLLIGTDVLWNMETQWENVDKIAKEFGIVCITRCELKYPDVLLDSEFYKPLIPYITFVPAPNKYLLLSSTAARNQLKIAQRAFRSLQHIVPYEIYKALIEGEFNEV